MTYNDLLTNHRLLLLELLERGMVQITAGNTPNAGLTIENRPLYSVDALLINGTVGIDPDFFGLLAASGFRVEIAAEDSQLLLTLAVDGETTARLLPGDPDDDDQPEPDESPTIGAYRHRR